MITIHWWLKHLTRPSDWYATISRTTRPPLKTSVSFADNCGLTRTTKSGDRVFLWSNIARHGYLLRRLVGTQYTYPRRILYIDNNIHCPGWEIFWYCSFGPEPAHRRIPSFREINRPLCLYVQCWRGWYSFVKKFWYDKARGKIHIQSTHYTRSHSDTSSSLSILYARIHGLVFFFAW